jgi:hypothetical protein
VRNVVSQESIMGPLDILNHTNDLPKRTFNTNHNNNTKIVSFSDNTSVIVNNPRFINFERDINTVFETLMNGLVGTCFP